MNSKIRVLHILWSGKSGGTERFVRDITVYSNKEAFEHQVVFLSKGGWIAEDVVNKGTKVHYLGMKSGYSIINAIKLCKLINEFKPNIIHNHVRNYFVGLLLILYFKIPKIYFEHGGDLMGRNPLKEILFYNCFGHFYKTILANSDHVKDEIKRVFRINTDRLKTFYIGINPQEYNNCFEENTLKFEIGISAESKVIGIVGRLVEAKGMEDFIKICAEINKISSEKHSYLIAGDGELRGTLERKAVECGVDIKFLGERKDIPMLLKTFDIFLFTSKWEPFGIVLLEAMASKIPIVGFEIEGMSEIVEKGAGVFLKNRDNFKLAKEVNNLLLNNEKRKELAEIGYENILKYFDIRRNIKKLEDEYYSVLELAQ